jgi:hypothetical protein
MPRHWIADPDRDRLDQQAAEDDYREHDAVPFTTTHGRILLPRDDAPPTVPDLWRDLARTALELADTEPTPGRIMLAARVLASEVRREYDR